MIMKKLLYVCFAIGFNINAFAQDKAVNAIEKSVNKMTSHEVNILNIETTNGSDGNEVRQKLFLAQQKTKELFDMVENQGLIVAGKSESELSAEIVKLAKDLFGM